MAAQALEIGQTVNWPLSVQTGPCSFALQEFLRESDAFGEEFRPNAMSRNTAMMLADSLDRLGTRHAPHIAAGSGGIMQFEFRPARSFRKLDIEVLGDGSIGYWAEDRDHSYSDDCSFDNLNALVLWLHGER